MNNNQYNKFEFTPSKTAEFIQFFTNDIQLCEFGHHTLALASKIADAEVTYYRALLYTTENALRYEKQATEQFQDRIENYLIALGDKDDEIADLKGQIEEANARIKALEATLAQPHAPRVANDTWAGEGYRFLDKGEILKETDQIWITCQGRYVNTSCPVWDNNHGTCAVYRRLIDSEAQNDYVVGRGYRQLQIGEVLKEGDEWPGGFKVNPWVETGWEGGRVGTKDVGKDNIYRRKIVTEVAR